MPDRLDLPQGTLDLNILKTFAAEPQHGWAIAQRIAILSRGVLSVRQGSLYPALHRLEHRGWIRSSWRTSESNRRARFYELARKGRRQLEAETEAWRTLTLAVDRVLEV